MSALTSTVQPASSMKDDAQHKWKSRAYWVLTGLMALELFAAGGGSILHLARPVEIIVQTLGYPEYVLTILGVAKLSAAGVLLAPKLPRLKEWAYAGIVIDLLGAIGSHLLSPNGVPFNIAIAFVFIAMVAGSYVLRPSSRRLEGATVR